MSSINATTDPASNAEFWTKYGASDSTGAKKLTGAQKIRADFMHLLITQLQNQNPMDPIDNAQMTSQLAQISQLERTEAMSVSIRANLAVSLIGKTVSFLPLGSSGVVERVNFVNGEERLIIGSNSVSLADVLSVAMTGETGA